MYKKIVIAIAALLLSSASEQSAFANCKEDIVEIQNKALNYITDLQISSDNIKKRPKLPSMTTCKKEVALEEAKAAMDRAEKLAKAGKNDMIKLPEFKYDGSER